MVTDRYYTPDLFVRTDAGTEGDPDARGFFVEAKGYLRSESRKLLRDLRKEATHLDLRFIVQKDVRLTKATTLVAWVLKYMRCPVAVFKGTAELDWQYPREKILKISKKGAT